jgi:uncharacterized protein YfbU (UPF0304 family)
MFTKAERLILANQYEILKCLDPSNSATYDEHKQIVTDGYEIFIRIWSR